MCEKKNQGNNREATSVDSFSCLCDGRRLCASHRACSTQRILTWCSRMAWDSHNAKRSPTLKWASCIQRKWKFTPRHTLNTTQTATGSPMQWKISGSRHCHHSQPVPMVAITSIHLASSQSISLRFYLPITYPSGAKTIRFNTTNTKARQWTQSQASCIHFACAHASLHPHLHLLLKTNPEFIQNWNTGRVQFIRFWILNDPQHYHFWEPQKW